MALNRRVGGNAVRDIVTCWALSTKLSKAGGGDSGGARARKHPLAVRLSIQTCRAGAHFLTCIILLPSGLRHRRE